MIHPGTVQTVPVGYLAVLLGRPALKQSLISTAVALADLVQRHPKRLTAAIAALLLGGALSDLLSRQTAEAMTGRGPKARLVEIEGVGHAPTLIAQEQIDVVASFLLNP